MAAITTAEEVVALYVQLPLQAEQSATANFKHNHSQARSQDFHKGGYMDV